MANTPKKKLTIIASISDKPDAFEIIAKDQANGMQFTIEIRAGKLLPKDIEFINNHIQKMLTQEPVKEFQESVGRA